MKLPAMDLSRLTRLAGAFYVLQMAFGVYAHVFARGALVVPGNAGETAANIVANPSLFRLSIASDLACYTSVLVAVWALYVLMRPFGPALSRLALCFRLSELALHFNAIVLSLATLQLVRMASASPEDAEVLQRLALGALAVQGHVVNLGFFLLGIGTAAFSVLLGKSRFAPLVLWVLGVVGGLVFSAIALGSIIFPEVSAWRMVAFGAMGLFEVGLGLWLLLRGAPKAVVPLGTDH